MGYRREAPDGAARGRRGEGGDVWFSAKILGFEARGLGFLVKGAGRRFGVSGLGFRVSSFGFGRMFHESEGGSMDKCREAPDGTARGQRGEGANSKFSAKILGLRLRG